MDIEVIDVKIYKFCVFAGTDAVGEELQNIKGFCLGSNVSRPFDVLSRYDDASSVGF